ncbi:hypothetical protein CHH75_05700 [Paenibacillus sp. 7541]|uniref:Uncharacterized protein n=1 Tax=Paenibacillus campinasensis TaxID=66347 RepID=A0A268ETM5_9BACL|nr:hypothetical protein CHH67_12750 [Paenibacillus campinasensis]PAK55014.1 hypothetical protein CHH75_05700 [Paenibacillus sp. 7541]
MANGKDLGSCDVREWGPSGAVIGSAGMNLLVWRCPGPGMVYNMITALTNGKAAWGGPATANGPAGRIIPA